MRKVLDRYLRRPAGNADERTFDESVADAVEMMESIRSAAVGYRVKLEADGFSTQVAEAMAAGLHAELMAKAFRG